MSIILVTHDLSVVSEFCDKVMVMYAGQMVEYGKLDEILKKPKHPPLHEKIIENHSYIRR